MAIQPTDRGDVFMREVDDAVREDMLVTFLRDYGKLLGGVIALGLAAYGGKLYYDHYRTGQAAVAGNALLDEIEAAQSGNIVGVDKYASTLKDAPPAINSHAKLVQANAQSQLGTPEGDAKALALYTALGKDATVTPLVRNTAKVRAIAMNGDQMAPAAIVTELSTIVADRKAPMWPAAAELTALALMQQNKRAEAAKLFSEIAAMPDVNPGTKSRVTHMTSMLGGATGTPAAAATGPADPAPKK